MIWKIKNVNPLKLSRRSAINSNRWVHTQTHAPASLYTWTNDDTRAPFNAYFSILIFRCCCRLLLFLLPHVQYTAVFFLSGSQNGIDNLVIEQMDESVRDNILTYLWNNIDNVIITILHMNVTIIIIIITHHRALVDRSSCAVVVFHIHSTDSVGKHHYSTWRLFRKTILHEFVLEFVAFFFFFRLSPFVQFLYIVLENVHTTHIHTQHTLGEIRQTIAKCQK